MKLSHDGETTTYFSTIQVAKPRMLFKLVENGEQFILFFVKQVHFGKNIMPKDHVMCDK